MTDVTNNENTKNVIDLPTQDLLEKLKLVLGLGVLLSGVFSVIGMTYVMFS